MLSEIQQRDLGLIKKAFEAIKTNYEPDWLEYERMYNSEHTQTFIDAAKEQDRNAIFIPLTFSTIQIANSVFMTSFFGAGNPIEVLKVGDSDEAKKNALKVVVDYYYRKVKPYVELEKAFLSAAIFGNGAVKIYWDEEEELPLTSMIPITEIAYDTEAISYQDNQLIAHRFTQTLQDIEAKFKSKFYKASPEDKSKLLDEIATSPFSRKIVSELYSKKGKKFMVRTFIDEICVREKEFKRCPIKHGFLIGKLPAIDSAKREKQIAAIGDSLVRIIKPLNEELNVKRNQRMDLIEKHINPEIFVPEKCGLDSEDMLRVGGIKSCDATTGIMFPPVVGASEFTNDVAMLKNDLEDVSAINGIMRGSTNASDRRSSTALATVTANSSIRLEAMVKMGDETIFSPWASDFVRYCYINVPDELVMELTENGENPLGQKGRRKELDIDIVVNFGVSINKQAKIQDLTTILQMLGNHENAKLDSILKELLSLILGENTNVEEILGVPTITGDENATGEAGGTQNKDAQANIEHERQLGGDGSDITNQGAGVDGELHKITSNQI